MDKIKRLLRLKKTWVVITALVGALGYTQYTPVVDFIGEVVTSSSAGPVGDNVTPQEE